MRDRGCVTSKSSIAHKAKARHKANPGDEGGEVGGRVNVVAEHGTVLGVVQTENHHAIVYTKTTHSVLSVSLPKCKV